MSRAHAIWATGGESEAPSEGGLIEWHLGKGAKRGYALVNGFTFATVEWCEPPRADETVHRSWHLEDWRDQTKPWRCDFGVPGECIATKYEATPEDAKAFCFEWINAWIKEVVRLSEGRPPSDDWRPLGRAEPEGPAP